MDRVSAAIPSLTELGFRPPDVIKPEDQNMSTYGDKGVLEKTSPQQKSIASRINRDRGGDGGYSGSGAGSGGGRGGEHESTSDSSGGMGGV